MRSVYLLGAFVALTGLSSGYVEFRDLTSPTTAMTLSFTVPQPYQVPTDVSMQFASQQSMITAVAPSITMAVNGSFETSWSIHYLQPDKHNLRIKGGVFRRQGVFSNATSYFATCTPCTSPITGTASGQCHVLTYSGVFRAGYTPSPTGSLCRGPGYTGALLPMTASSLPCCPSCTPPANTSVPITTGVLATNSSSTAMTTSVSVTSSGSVSASGNLHASQSADATTTITIITNMTTVVPPSPTSSLQTIVISSAVVISRSTTIISSTTTVLIPGPLPEPTSTETETDTGTDTGPGTSASTTTTPITSSSIESSGPIISRITVTPPPNATNSETPITLVRPAKVSGCGTASGSGTIIGSGTVYVGPYGMIPVISSGTVSGFASTVIGCGTILATSGVFTGTASITGCGEGDGYATLVGSGTVYPAIFRGLISVVSSGTVTGSGRVVGCGSLVGTGTFTVKSLYTTTITPSPRPTVNVYISYCPAEPVWRIGSNFSAIDGAQVSANELGKYMNSTFGPAVATSSLGLNISSLAVSNHTTTNLTSNSTLTNPFCQMCPNDAGICCPLTVACGADGHCPYTALQGSGYILFGTNIVDYKNSSTDMGMEKAPWKIAPGLPGEESSLTGISKQNVVRRLKHKHKNKRNGHRKV